MLSLSPRSDLRDRVASIIVADRDGGDMTVLPSTGAVLGFQRHGRVRTGDTLLSVAGVTGILKNARRYDYVGPTLSVLVRFTPQGAACLGVPASELTNASVPLDFLIPKSREIVERFRDAATIEAAVDIVQDFLAQRTFQKDPLVEQALKVLSVASDEEVLVAELARSLSMSERQLERRFLERVGSTPKRYASLLRFERAVARMGSGVPLGQVAQEAGYYDQSHFIRECRRFSGMTPSALIRSR